MPFYDVDEMGFAAQLSPLCHTAPFGETVYAENVQKAIDHGQKLSKGRRSIRRRRYEAQPGDKISVGGEILTVKGAQHYGEYLACSNGKSYPAKKTNHVSHAGAWLRIN